MSTFKKFEFKFNDVVYDYQYGEGKIYCIDPMLDIDNHQTLIGVDFENDSKLYTLEGIEQGKKFPTLLPNANKEISIGSIVVPKEMYNGCIVYPFSSGCSKYDYTIVGSLVPFELVSERGDMKWYSSYDFTKIEKIGECTDEVLEVIGTRCLTQHDKLVIELIEVLSKFNLGVNAMNTIYREIMWYKR